ncbi:hypothetical protein D3C85_1042100 [compost metagenome]
MLGQVPGEADQLAGQCQHPAQHRAVRLEAVFAQALGRRQAVAPAAAAIGQGVDLVTRQAQHLGDIAHRPRGMVGTGHSGERGAVTAIALEHILQHLFAALVLEIHVDVWWLVALAGHEAFEQHVHPRRVDLGDAQGVAHRRVGRRTAALAENLLAAGEAHDVMDGEEVTLVTQLGNQRQLALDQVAGLLRHALRPAPGHALLAQMAQPGRGRLPLRDQFTRVLIAQLAEVEPAAPGDVQGLLQQLRRVEFGQLLQRAQVALAVGKQHMPGLGHCGVMANGSHGILQRPPPACVHVHIAAGHRRDAYRRRQRQQLSQALAVIGATVQLHGQPQALAKLLMQPVPGRRVRAAVRYPQRQQPVQ